MLNLDPDHERLALLEAIDQAVDMDTNEAWEHLAALEACEPKDDIAPLFDAPRVVPVLDQLALF